MTDDEMRTAFETVLEKMLLAGWLRDFRFIEGKGFHLGINEKGVEKLGVLKELGDLFGISDDDRRAVSLCIVSKGLAFPDSEWEVVGEIPAEVLDFVGSVLDELEIRGDDLILTKVIFHIGLGWG